MKKPAIEGLSLRVLVRGCLLSASRTLRLWWGKTGRTKPKIGTARVGLVALSRLIEIPHLQ